MARAPDPTRSAGHLGPTRLATASRSWSAWPSASRLAEPLPLTRTGGACPARLGIQPWPQSAPYCLARALQVSLTCCTGRWWDSVGLAVASRPGGGSYRFALWALRPWLTLVLLSSGRVALASRSWLTWAPASTRSSAFRLAPASRFWLPGPSPSVRSGSFRFAPASRLSQLAQLTCAPSASPWRRVHGSPWLPASTCRAGHCIACPDGHCASGSPRPRLDFGLGLVVLSLHRSGAAGLTYPGALTSPPLELVPWCCVSAVVGTSPRRASS